MDPCNLHVGTEAGVATLHWDGEAVTDLVHADVGGTVRELSVNPDATNEVLAACGLRGWGLYLTEDCGETWESMGFEDAWVWGVTRDPGDPDTVYVGTEPPGIYRSSDGGRTWTDISDFDDLPSRDRWTFFYEPFEAGHVHGISVDPAAPDRIYAGLEHGAFLYTHDGGETWHDALHGYDLHDTAFVPDGESGTTDASVVLASAGEGLFLSEDGGASWTEQGFSDWYVKDLLVVDNADSPTGSRVYVDAAQGAGNTEASIWTSTDGREWTELPEVPKVGVTGSCLLAVAPDGTLLHVAGDGESGQVVAFEEGRWREIGPVFDAQVRALAIGPA